MRLARMIGTPVEDISSLAVGQTDSQFSWNLCLTAFPCALGLAMGYSHWSNYMYTYLNTNHVH